MTEAEIAARLRSHFDAYLETMDAASAHLRAGVRGAAFLARSSGASEADVTAAFEAESRRANEVLNALCERQGAVTN